MAAADASMGEEAPMDLDPPDGPGRDPGAAAPAAPSRLASDRYKKFRVLRETLYGKVYYGIDLDTEQKVVIKECRRWNVENRVSLSGIRVQENVHAEIELHRHLCAQENPPRFLLRLIDVYSDQVNINIVLEFCSNGDLFTHVSMRDDPDPSRRPCLGERDAAKFMRQLVATVSFMHEHRIAHRDLSLENIMLDDDCNLKVIDFGCAGRYGDSWRQHRGRIGKVAYMAPEVYGNAAYDGRRADIWSCGVIMFTILVGAPPYEMPDRRDPRFIFVVTGRLRDLLQRWGVADKFSAHALDLVQRMLTPEQSRISMEDILAHPFFAER